jgi:hypothetical protein
MVRRRSTVRFRNGAPGISRSRPGQKLTGHLSSYAADGSCLRVGRNLGDRLLLGRQGLAQRLVHGTARNSASRLSNSGAGSADRRRRVPRPRPRRQAHLRDAHHLRPGQHRPGFPLAAPRLTSPPGAWRCQAQEPSRLRRARAGTGWWAFRSRSERAPGPDRRQPTARPGPVAAAIMSFPREEGPCRG